MRFGLGWRAELGAGIVADLGEIDVLQVLAERFVDATRDQKKALRFLRSQVPLVVHGTSLGLASTERVTGAGSMTWPAWSSGPSRSSGPSTSPSCAPAVPRLAISPRRRATTRLGRSGV